MMAKSRFAGGAARVGPGRVAGRSRVALLAVAFLLAGALDAAAQTPLYDKPVYDPASKSYFQLSKVGHGYSRRGAPEGSWDVARRLAAGRSFKGVRGRLAVVASPATSSFLMRTFQPDRITWIGLRYWCSVRRLQWVTGDLLPRGSFENWDSRWDRTGVSGCSYVTDKKWYLPVACTEASTGFRWFVQGPKKEYYAYFIEFPTGKP